MNPELELRCLAYELRTLSRRINAGELERWVPGFCSPVTEREHAERYRWACRFTPARSVLDVACGSGRGALVMAVDGTAASVVGVDVDPETVAYAGARHSHPAVEFVAADAQDLAEIDGLFDVAVSFETIEHLPDPAAFLDAVAGRLRAHGTFVVSTPIAAVPHVAHPENVFHAQEWGLESFAALVSSHFRIVERLIQPSAVLLRRVERARMRFERLTGQRRHALELYRPVPLLDLSPVQRSALGSSISAYQILVCEPA